MRVPIVATMLLVIALAGCFGERSSPIELTPYYELQDAEPGRSTTLVIHPIICLSQDASRFFMCTLELMIISITHEHQRVNEEQN
mgnify:CR=1 FL=1